MARFGEVQPHDSVVNLVPYPKDQSRRFSAVDQADGAVMAQQQVVRQFADRGRRVVAVASYGQQKLVLCRRQACCLRLLLAPTLEAAKPCSQSQQAGVRRVRKAHKRQR